MPRIILMMSVSVDGLFEGPDASLEWQTVDEELHQHFNDELRQMRAFLGGRVTHELMAGYWPTADQQEGAAGPEIEFAAIWRDTPKVVYSRTLTQADWNTTIVREVVPEEVRELRDSADGDLLLGGAVTGARFMELGLVDELRLYVHPVVLGSGRRLFPDAGPTLTLELEESRVFESGVVLLKYRRAQS